MWNCPKYWKWKIVELNIDFFYSFPLNNFFIIDKNLQRVIYLLHCRFCMCVVDLILITCDYLQCSLSFYSAVVGCTLIIFIFNRFFSLISFLFVLFFAYIHSYFSFFLLLSQYYRSFNLLHRKLDSLLFTLLHVFAVLKSFLSFSLAYSLLIFFCSSSSLVKIKKSILKVDILFCHLIATKNHSSLKDSCHSMHCTKWMGLREEKNNTFSATVIKFQINFLLLLAIRLALTVGRSVPFSDILHQI